MRRSGVRSPSAPPPNHSSRLSAAPAAPHHPEPGEDHGAEPTRLAAPPRSERAPAVSGKRRRRRLVGGVGLEADPYRDPAVVHVGAGKAGPALGVRFTELDAERALGAARQKADVVRPAVRGPLARVALGARAGRLG